MSAGTFWRRFNASRRINDESKTGGSSLPSRHQSFFSYVAKNALLVDDRETMETKAKLCRICRAEIPAERLEVIPDTLVCVKCSKKIGGEFELEVKVGGTGKAGSLKITGQEVTVKRQRRRLV